MPAPPLKLVLDWDGTITVRDTLWMLMERFGDQSRLRPHRGRARRRRSRFRDVMEVQMATITAPLDEAVAFLVAEARVRDGFAALAERYRPAVLSSGFHETIEPILAREGVERRAASRTASTRGPTAGACSGATTTPCPVCGDLCKRRALPAGRPLVYVGDGYSDRCAALAADRVFARARPRRLPRLAEPRPSSRSRRFDDVAAALT